MLEAVCSSQNVGQFLRPHVAASQKTAILTLVSVLVTRCSELLSNVFHCGCSVVTNRMEQVLLRAAHPAWGIPRQSILQHPRVVREQTFTKPSSSIFFYPPCPYRYLESPPSLPCSNVYESYRTFSIQSYISIQSVQFDVHTEVWSFSLYKIWMSSCSVYIHM
jgi:hypothetical protein